MNETISQAITILVVGMTTVFFILLMVVVSANLLIRFLNAYDLVLNKEESSQPKERIPKDIIQEAIAQWSGGRASVKKITKK